MIWNALSFGSILENVIIDPETRDPDYADTQLTENTRACYPLERIEKRVIENQGREPHVVIFSDVRCQRRPSANFDSL